MKKNEKEKGRNSSIEGIKNLGKCLMIFILRFEGVKTSADFAEIIGSLVLLLVAAGKTEISCIFFTKRVYMHDYCMFCKENKIYSYSFSREKEREREKREFNCMWSRYGYGVSLYSKFILELSHGFLLVFSTSTRAHLQEFSAKSLALSCLTLMRH